MEKTTTAILLATYNGARYLREQIESIYAQTYTNFEIICVNDGSTDNEIIDVLDPTFLLKKEEWDKVLTERLIDEPYIFCYI